jgi:hypothetical protein
MSTIGFSVVPYAHAIVVTFRCSPAFAYDISDGPDTAKCNVQTGQKVLEFQKCGIQMASEPPGPRHGDLDLSVFID